MEYWLVNTAQISLNRKLYNTFKVYDKECIYSLKINIIYRIVSRGITRGPIPGFEVKLGKRSNPFPLIFSIQWVQTIMQELSQKKRINKN
jgi:hypothetical protein